MGTVGLLSVCVLTAMLLMQCPCQQTPTPGNWPTGASTGANSVSLLKGGYSTEVQFQLYLNEEPYLVDGFRVLFTLVDLSIACFSDCTGKYETFTIDGRANATIVSGNKSGTTLLYVSSCNQQVSMSVNVLGYGSISGFVTDTQQNAIPGATITLWPNAYHNVTTGRWEHDATTSAIDPFVPDNPQYAGDGTMAPAGTYTFSHVPLGTYMVEADASLISGNDSHNYFAVVDLLTEGTETANVVIPGHVIMPTTSPITTTMTTTSTTTTTTTTTTMSTTVSTTTTTSSGSDMALVCLVTGITAVLFAVRLKGNRKGF